MRKKVNSIGWESPKKSIFLLPNSRIKLTELPFLGEVSSLNSGRITTKLRRK